MMEANEGGREVGVVLTGQYRARMDGGIYQRYEEVPDIYKPRLERQNDEWRSPDFANMLRRGTEWVLDPLRILQPNSYEAFQQVVSPLQLGIVLIANVHNPDGPPLVTPVMFFDASGRMVEVLPTFSGRTYEEGYDTADGALQSLPEALAKSWLWRTKGWRMPSSPFQGPLVNRRLVCHPMQGWRAMEDVLMTYDKKRWKWMFKVVREMFPDAVVTSRHWEDGSPIVWTSMRCFLDTRPAGVEGPVGDQFFVIDSRRDQVVYHIHQGDVEGIRMLTDPAEAMDHYCAHLLRAIPGDFDFSPWSVPLN